MSSCPISITYFGIEIFITAGCETETVFISKIDEDHRPQELSAGDFIFYIKPNSLYAVNEKLAQALGLVENY